MQFYCVYWEVVQACLWDLPPGMPRLQETQLCFASKHGSAILYCGEPPGPIGAVLGLSALVLNFASSHYSQEVFLTSLAHMCAKSECATKSTFIILQSANVNKTNSHLKFCISTATHNFKWMEITDIC